VAYSSSTLYGRPNLTALALGIHQAIFDDTIAFCRERELYGEPLAKLPTIAQKLGDMNSRLMTARLVAYHAEIFAGRGCQTDHHVERYLRDVIHTFPAAGTSDVQRLRLAEVALGAYRGAWSSRLGTLADELLEAA
jgi:acyl-CoA dehydrogenase